MLVLVFLLLSGCAMPPRPSPPIVPAAAAAPVRVIAELKPVAGLPLRASISQAQDAVIAALPAGRATVVQRYTTLPLLSLEVDPALIDTIRQNPAVVRVSPDVERTPQNE